MCHSYQIWTLHVGNEICDLLCGLKQSSIVIWIDFEAFASVLFLSLDLKALFDFLNNSIVFGKFLSVHEAINSVFIFRLVIIFISFVGQIDVLTDRKSPSKF